MIGRPENRGQDSDHPIIRSSDHLKLFIIAGEASGDQLGAAVLNSITHLSPLSVDVRGIGGPLMATAGLKESLFPMTDLSVMGIAEVLPRLPQLFKRSNQTVTAIIEFQPDIVLTIDSPDFCFRVQKKVRQNRYSGLARVPQTVSEGPPGQARGPVSPITQLHIVAPSVWAWRPGRAAKIAQFLDGLLCLFPFEPPYFERYGLRAGVMGHPVIHQISPRHPNAPLGHILRLGLYLGSRAGVIQRHAPVMVGALKKLNLDPADTRIIIPTFDHLRPLLTLHLADLAYPYEFVTEPEARRAVMSSLDAALAVSGTVGLELAVAGVPHVVGYRMNMMTYILARILVKRNQRAHLANIILDQDIVPELLQAACTPSTLAAALSPLLRDTPDRAAQIGAFDNLRAALGAGDPVSPGDKAARFILGFAELV